jgi:hypothetical protein
MLDVTAIATIFDPRTNRTTIRSFTSSPVRVRRGRWSTLRLDDVTVDSVHGEIWFGPEFVSFTNLATRTWLNGRQISQGTCVPLMILPTCSVLYDICDPDEVLAYLLDPSDSDAGTEELRDELQALIQWARRLAVPRARGYA